MVEQRGEWLHARCLHESLQHVPGGSWDLEGFKYLIWVTSDIKYSYPCVVTLLITVVTESHGPRR